MHENHLYNLFNQLVEEHKSVWRIESMYKEDASGCEDCTAFWEALSKDKAEHSAALTELIKTHLA